MKWFRTILNVLFCLFVFKLQILWSYASTFLNPPWKQTTYFSVLGNAKYTDWTEDWILPIFWHLTLITAPAAIPTARVPGPNLKSENPLKPTKTSTHASDQYSCHDQNNFMWLSDSSLTGYSYYHTLCIHLLITFDLQGLWLIITLIVSMVDIEVQHLADLEVCVFFFK